MYRLASVERSFALVCRWIKQTGLEHPTLVHLKRARKRESGVTVLLSSLELHHSPPTVPPEMENFKVYQAKVPAYPAITITSMKVKQPIWPVVYAPPRKHEPDEWTAGEVKWATTAMKQVIAYALSRQRKGEVCSDPFRIRDYLQVIPGTRSLGRAETVLSRGGTDTGLPRR